MAILNSVVSHHPYCIWQRKTVWCTTRGMISFRIQFYVTVWRWSSAAFVASLHLLYRRNEQYPSIVSGSSPFAFCKTEYCCMNKWIERKFWTFPKLLYLNYLKRINTNLKDYFHQWILYVHFWGNGYKPTVPFICLFCLVVFFFLFFFWSCLCVLPASLELNIISTKPGLW